MSVVIETTLGDITVDLYLDQRPVTCLNFLKLCKMKFYNYNLFHSIRSGFIAQTGDPTGEGSGGQSIFGVLEGPEKRFFSGEKMPKIRHTDAGLLSMVCTGDMMVGSQFFFTLASDLDSLDGVHCVIGEVSEGHDVLRKLNDVICDESHRPYRDVRITHTVVLEDPFSDPPGLRAPSRSPSPSAERMKGGRIAPDEEIDETQGKSAAEVQEIIEEKEAKARATILEIIGDLPDAEIAPPENVLFVCKLNPVTTDDDLEIIFSRFGKIVTCEVIRDKKTGDSLQYAFIEFADKKSCEDAYFKMDNVLIDDRRIHVDFSQSVSKIKWLGKGRGVRHLNDDEINANHVKRGHSKSRERDYKNGRDHNNDRDSYNDRKRYENRDRFRDKEKHYERSRKDKEHSSISKSKSDRPIDEYRNDRNRTHYNPRHPEKDNRDEYHILDKHNNSKDSKKSHRTRDPQNNAGKFESTSKKDKEKSEHTLKRHNKEKYEGKDKNKDTKRHRSNEDRENNKSKRKHYEIESKKEVKKLKLDKVPEPRTPSPSTDQREKNKKSNIHKGTKKRIKDSSSIKKKRKASTSSSDSGSSDSSSSSESTSSSEEERKKSVKKRKKKYSSSSSSSDSSSSSSSSSNSSSSTTSSSESESGKKKKQKMAANKKIIRKPKIKL